MSDSSQVVIPCTRVRVGTTEGLFFLGTDLSTDLRTRDRLIAAAIESYNSGDTCGTKKFAIVSRSWKKGIDVEYLYGQVSSERPGVDVSLNLGDLLAGVGPIAIAAGIVKACDGATPVSIYCVNTANAVVAYVPTPQGDLNCEAGASRTSSSRDNDIRVDFSGTAGAVCGALLPTGRVVDMLGMYRSTLIDNGAPLVIICASDFEPSGRGLSLEIGPDPTIQGRGEELRIAAGQLMKLGDVRLRNIPKMTFVSAPERGGDISAFTLIRHNRQPAISALEAITIGAACVLPGSTASTLLTRPVGTGARLYVEQPAGEYFLELELESIGSQVKVLRSSIISTAQILSRDEILLPRRL